MQADPRHRVRGIFLIGVLLLVVLLLMFAGASLDLAPWASRRASNDSDLAAARRASLTGIEYALARLRREPGWMGGSDRQFLETNTFSQLGFSGPLANRRATLGAIMALTPE